MLPKKAIRKPYFVLQEFQVLIHVTNCSLLKWIFQIWQTALISFSGRWYRYQGFAHYLQDCQIAFAILMSTLRQHLSWKAEINLRWRLWFTLGWPRVKIWATRSSSDIVSKPEEELVRPEVLCSQMQISSFIFLGQDVTFSNFVFETVSHRSTCVRTLVVFRSSRLVYAKTRVTRIKIISFKARGNYNRTKSWWNDFRFNPSSLDNLSLREKFPWSWSSSSCLGWKSISRSLQMDPEKAQKMSFSS